MNASSDDTQLLPEQFNMVMMSFIHDIKNSLLMSLGNLDALSEVIESEHPDHKEKIALTQYELRRINNALVQLLSLYKMEHHLFSVNIDQHNVYDFLDDILITNTPGQTANHLDISLECEEDLNWFFDTDLIASIINNVLNNTLRYASKRILISAYTENQFLVIAIEDDGEGFPDKLFHQADNLETVINMKTGSTGLGLYFAEQISRTHRNKERTGYTRIDNDSSLGGGRFQLFLP